MHTHGLAVLIFILNHVLSQASGKAVDQFLKARRAIVEELEEASIESFSDLTKKFLHTEGAWSSLDRSVEFDALCAERMQE